MTEHGLATKTRHEEFRVWRHVNGRDRKWTTKRTRADANQVVTGLRKEGMKMPLGIERVLVTEESDGIEWLDSGHVEDDEFARDAASLDTDFSDLSEDGA